MSDFERDPSRTPPTTRTSVFLQVGLGAICTFMLHGIVGILLSLTSGIAGGLLSSSGSFGVVELVAELPVLWMMTVGVSQVLYVGPVMVAAWFVRRPLALGLAIGAALTFLLQGACYGLFAAFLAGGGLEGL